MKRLEAQSKMLQTTGGILADDMGMGKTLSILSLIAEPVAHLSKISPQMIGSTSTLIVAPLSGMFSGSNPSPFKLCVPYPSVCTLLLQLG